MSEEGFGIRLSGPTDRDAVRSLTRAAFGRADEATLLDELEAGGSGLFSLVSGTPAGISGHLQVFRIGVEGAPVAAGIGPVSVVPELQGKGIGSALVEAALKRLRNPSGRPIAFIVGDEGFYSRFGFTREKAGRFASPFGEHLLAMPLGPGAPHQGTLTYPGCFLPKD